MSKQLKPLSEKLREQRLEKLENAWRKVVNDPDGRLVLYNIIEMAGIFRKNELTNARVYLENGKANFGKDILGIISGYSDTFLSDAYREMIIWEQDLEKTVNEEQQKKRN